MSDNLHLVFSKPPEAVSDEEYNSWYDFHLSEILVVPGFVSARRYRLQTVKGEWTPSGHSYLSAYELEGKPRDVMRELDKEVASGRMKLPEWFPDITFASFNCYSHGNPARGAAGRPPVPGVQRPARGTRQRRVRRLVPRAR